MFYDSEIMNHKNLSAAWKAAHNLPTAQSRQQLPKICTAISGKIKSKLYNPRKRLSLRTSALFVGGASRLYKTGVEDLYKDVVKLYREIIDRKGHRLYEDMEDTDGESDDDDVVTVMNESTKDSPTKQDARTAADEHPPTSSSSAAPGSIATPLISNSSQITTSVAPGVNVKREVVAEDVPAVAETAHQQQIPDASKWSVAEVAQFIQNIPGCVGIARKFALHEVDGEALLLVKPEHLMQALSIKLGPALKIMARINELRLESQ